MAGALVVGQTARADDHWCDGERRGTRLSITSGTVSIGTHVEVSDLVIVNDDDSQTSGDLFLSIVASQNPDGRRGHYLLDVEDSHPNRDVLLRLRWISNREPIQLDPGGSTRIRFRSALREPPPGTYGLYARVYEWNSSRPDNGARCFAAAWDFEQQATFGEADDHGDTLSTATRVALPSETGGVIDSGTDTDWFRFEVAASGEATVETTGGLDTVGALYSANGARLAFDDDSGAGENFRIQRQLDAGTYYVEVESFGNGTGSYTLRLGFAASDDGTTAAVPAGDHLRNLGDFNGDGRADVLLRHADGRWRYYPMDGATVLAGNGAANLTRDLAWRIAGTGDFDGDGKDDVLLRKTDGRWFFYPMDGRNVLAGRGTVRMTRDLAWQVAGIGDLDGDGKDDVLMRHEDGRWHYYRMDGRRPLSGSGSGRLTRDLNWQVAGVGDFDGDGRDDVLLRRRDDGRWYFYPMNGRASIAGRGTVPLTRDLAWAVAGVGDFDADGRHDVLLRHADGRWRYYPLQGRRVLDGAGPVNLSDDTSTTVAGIGDLNYDGCDDVLARLANGGWQYYALDGRRVLAASGEAALTGNLAWAALASGGTATGQAPTLGATLPARSLTSGRNVTINLADAFEDDQTLAYEARTSNADVVRASVDGDVLTLTPVAEGTATVTVTARDPDGNAVTQTFAVTVAESGGGSGGDTFRDCAECPLMVRIPAGTFTMGAPESEPHTYDDERPQRTVSIPAFAASAHEVTFAEWDACVAAGGCGGHSPRDSGWGRDERPVMRVSWNDAQSYVDWLSRASGQRYRLLTESEWEYAARAGTTTPFHTGETITPQQANYDGTSGYPSSSGSGLYRMQTVPVGSFAPNGFGLHDMHGNVREWVQDCYGDYGNAPSDGSAAEREGCSKRVYRGGSWVNEPLHLRSANRRRADPGFLGDTLGFRVARTL